MEWRRLLDGGAKRRFGLVFVFKLDRDFRWVTRMHDTLAAREVQGSGFHAVREGFDTRTALGQLPLNLLASRAEFELEVLRERVRAGMDRAPQTLHREEAGAKSTSVEKARKSERCRTKPGIWLPG